MKLTFKSMMKNALIVLSLVFLVAGCKHDPDISQDTYHLVTPTFKAGDVYLLHSYLEGGSGDENDYYYFSSETGGTVIVNTTISKSEYYDLAKYSFTYNSGDSKVEGNDWLSFMMVDDYVHVYNKQYCFKRQDGKTGLLGTFVSGSDKITFSKSGTAEAYFSGHTFEVKFKNEEGVVTIWDSSSSLKFYFLKEGYLVPFNAVSSLSEADMINIYTIMDTSDEGKKLPEFIKGLPDGLYYQLSNKTDYGAAADLATVKEILTENPNKKFAITLGVANNRTYTHKGEQNGYIKKIPSNFFEGLENLYQFAFGSLYNSNRITLEEGAFKNCKNLKKLWGSVSISTFGKSCFEGCAALEDVQVSKDSIIEPNAFKDCSSDLLLVGNGYKKVTVSEDKDFTNSIDITNHSEKKGKLITSTYVDYYWKFE